MISHAMWLCCFPWEGRLAINSPQVLACLSPLQRELLQALNHLRLISKPHHWNTPLGLESRLQLWAGLSPDEPAAQIHLPKAFHGCVCWFCQTNSTALGIKAACPKVQGPVSEHKCEEELPDAGIFRQSQGTSCGSVAFQVYAANMFDVVPQFTWVLLQLA